MTAWFAAIHLRVTAKNGISSVELRHRFGVRQATTWVMKRKIMTVIARRDGDNPLSGRVEMDEDYLGVVRSIALPPARIKPPTAPCARRLAEDTDHRI